MIPAREVADAVVAAAVAGVDGVFPVADTSAPPDPRPDIHVVLEWPAGSGRSGSLGAPEAHAELVVRVRGVARSSTPAVARQASQHAAHTVAAALLDRSVPITGTGWVVSGRRIISDAGTDLEGTVANAVIDLGLTAVPA